MPKVTVLMPVYNAEKYLCEAISSILNQTLKDFEFLIINDGSTDGTAKILQSYRDPRIKIINNKKNLGLTKSLNKGLKAAKGEYIARMDADDISLPERLERQIEIAKKNPWIAVIATGVEFFVDAFNKKNIVDLGQSGNETELVEFGDLLKTNILAHGSVLFKKRNILALGGYNEKFEKAQDYDLWLRVAKQGKIIKLKEILYLKRLHFSNISLSNIKKQERYVEIIRRRNQLSKRNITRSNLKLQEYEYRTRIMLRLFSYASIFLKNNHCKEGIYLLLRSFIIYPSLSSLKQLVLVPLVIIYKSLLARVVNQK